MPEEAIPQPPTEPIPVDTPLSDSGGDYENPVDASSLMKRFEAQQSGDAPEPNKPAEEAQPEPNKPAEGVTPEPASDELTPEEVEAAKDMPGPKTKKAVSKWTELKRNNAELAKLKEEVLPKREAEFAELKQKLEELESQAPDTSELEAKQKLIDEYEQKLAVHDIRNSKQFEQEVSAPVRELGENLNAVAAAYEIDPNRLKDAVVESDPATQRRALNDLMDGMQAYDQLTIRQAVDQMKKITAKANELEQNAYKAKEELDFLKQDEERKAAEKAQRDLSLAAEQVKKQFVEKLPDVFKTEGLSDRVFASPLEADSPVMQAYNAYSGALLPEVVKQHAAALKEIAALKDAERKRQDANPRAGGGGDPNAQPVTQPEGGSMMQRFQQFKAQNS